MSGNDSGAVITTVRLRLEPLRVAHTDEMVEVLGDPSLYDFTGGTPPTPAELRRRYAAQVAGPDEGGETWWNWIIRLDADAAAIGFVQATVTGDGADVAWLIGRPHQGRGYAVEAATGMLAHLAETGVEQITAHIHPAHRASAAVATRIGLSPTSVVDEDGEVIWRSGLTSVDMME